MTTTAALIRQLADKTRPKPSTSASVSNRKRYGDSLAQRVREEIARIAAEKAARLSSSSSNIATTSSSSSFEYKAKPDTTKSVDKTDKIIELLEKLVSRQQQDGEGKKKMVEIATSPIPISGSSVNNIRCVL